MKDTNKGRLGIFIEPELLFQKTGAFPEKAFIHFAGRMTITRKERVSSNILPEI